MAYTDAQIQSLVDLARNSPYYQQAAAAARAANDNYGLDRQAGIRALLTAYGELPAGFIDKYGDLDQATKASIAANTTSGLSTVARLKQARDDAQRTMLRGLAAKGLRRSGARGYQLNRNQLAFDQAKQDAINQLLGNTKGLYSNYTQNVYNTGQQLDSAFNNAISQVSRFWNPDPPSSGGSSGGGLFGGWTGVGAPGTAAAIAGRPHVGGPMDW